MKDTSYDEIKALTDSIYGGTGNPDAADFISVLNKNGITLRQKDGQFYELTYSIPISQTNCILIGIRYTKKDGTHTEDHFLFEKGKPLRSFYGRQIESVLPEYKGTHKKQIKA